MKRNFLLGLMAVIALVGCAGVPLMSAIKLAAINPIEIIEGDPRHLMLALNVDASIKGSREKRPLLHLKAEPNVVGDYEKFERFLDFELSSVEPRSLGLSDKTNGRAWLIYRLSPAAVKGVRDFQAYIEQGRQRKEKKGGGSLNIVLDNEWLAEIYPQYRDTQVQIWLQLNVKDQFLEVWSGRLSAAKKT